ncbi:hypothetical protein NP590_11440 [Methylomonas sp. SURF-2]|uniref:Glycoside hydrolase family 42 N-terminal domain-containing protein n=1 Tax=Methylomonas subterranea TaxID=2952225 RepID=A0ABT1TGY4_9GAMM|nr:hypothetical protein [Methylomonas sp. SURF-2]MCQ8104720.1 hypothetical protein [Methylomonas sp. SURF-2]
MIKTLSQLTVFFVAEFVFALVLLYAAPAFADFPIVSSTPASALLLDLGSRPMRMAEPALTLVSGDLRLNAAEATVQVADDEIVSLHPGFGDWETAFRFQLAAAPEAGAYRFWARWRQGGEPDVCIQNFEIWAGPKLEQLEKRATFALKPKGWQPAWIGAEGMLNLRSGDRVVEVRNSGAGQDAKAFDAFLLAQAKATLPVSLLPDKPAVLLELGKAPHWAGLEKPAGLRVITGDAKAGRGAESLLMLDDEAQVFHQGFGDWQANFAFHAEPALVPGRYRFFARYKSGGEASQVSQRFSVKAGASPERLTMRADLTTSNSTPWEYQWLAASDSINLLPGDSWLEIGNSGRADGAKVFDAFLLQLETPQGDWMSPEQAEARKRFLSSAAIKANAQRRLYVLDGKGEGGELLFAGLAAGEAQKHLQPMSVEYLLGEPALEMAKALNVSLLPAAVVSDNKFTLLGVLNRPRSAEQVAAFLADPAKAGHMPAPPPVYADVPQPLRRGMPAAWLVGGLQDGPAGVSINGLDSETVLRPNPDQAYLSQQMMGGAMKLWRAAVTQSDAGVEIFDSAEHTYDWSRGTGYAQLYLHSPGSARLQLHLAQSGIRSAAWLDGRTLRLQANPKPPAGFSSAGEPGAGLLKGSTAPAREAPQLAELDFAPGWHSLLLKLVMRHEQGQRFFFKTLFTDTDGQPSQALQTQLSDPSADLALNRIAGLIRPLVFVDAPANLPHAGDAVKLTLDMRWQPISEQNALPAPLSRFQAKLRLRVLNYSGKRMAEREIDGVFPGQVDVDLGPISEPGYYAVFPSLYTPDGRLIMQYPADGFSVVAGHAAQKQRLADKKLWNNDYYALADGDNSFRQTGAYFEWLRRMGIFNSYGSYPGFDSQYLPQWQQARQLGLQLFADSAGDSHWLNDEMEAGRNFIDAAAGFTRYFKASNEIDIRHEAEWQTLREPQHWLARVKSEYQRAHQARPDAHYVGGSLVRPGEGDWFKQVLQLGLDRYQDAWDVHAYPQKAPRFDRPLGNGGTEDERGVLAVYDSLGQQNRLPFWLGETGAKAMHGFNGRRWQAEQAAKMIAWVNSRADYLGLAFCIAHEYDLAYGRMWDYSMGHKPGEAALYTAGALIDGLPYQAVAGGDGEIQAASFGSTLMVWRDDEGVSEWPLQLDPGKTWLVVDVVGESRPLPVDDSGHARLTISASPLYVLPRDDYQTLTRY